MRLQLWAATAMFCTNSIVLAVESIELQEPQAIWDAAREKQLQRKPREAADLYRMLIETNRGDLERSAPALVNWITCFQLLKGDSQAEREYARLSAKFLATPPPLDGTSAVTLKEAQEELLWKAWNHISLDAKKQKVSAIAAGLSKQLGIEIVCTLARYLKLQEEWQEEYIKRDPSYAKQGKEYLDKIRAALNGVPEEDPEVDLQLANVTFDEALYAFGRKSGFLPGWDTPGKTHKVFLPEKAMRLIYGTWAESAADIETSLQATAIPDQILRLGRCSMYFRKITQQYYDHGTSGVKLESPMRSVNFDVVIPFERGMKLNQPFAHKILAIGEDGKEYPAELVHDMSTRQKVDKHHVSVMGDYPGNLQIQFLNFPPKLSKLKSIKGTLHMCQTIAWEHQELALKVGSSMRIRGWEEQEVDLKLLSFETTAGEYKVGLSMKEIQEAGVVASARASASASSEMGDPGENFPIWLRGKNGKKICAVNYSSGGNSGGASMTLQFPAKEAAAALVYSTTKETSTRELSFEFKEVELP